MILPNKYIPASDSTLGQAGALLSLKDRYSTVSELWHAFNNLRPDATFDSYTQALTLLFIIGAVTIESGLLKWQV